MTRADYLAFGTAALLIVEFADWLARQHAGQTGALNAALGIDGNVTASSTTGGTTGTAVPSSIPGVPTVTANPLQGLPYVPTWLGGTGQGITRGGPTQLGGILGSAVTGLNPSTPAQTPGSANPVPGFSAIGSWLKSITGIGQ
jgi:hypothetical protein